MSIEHDIQQQSFRSNRQKAMINLIYTYNWLMERVKNFLAAEGITPQQYNILRILRGANPVPLSTLQIRERMLDKASDTSRIVDRLVTKGLAQKSICATDKRLVDVLITDKGLDLLHKLASRDQDMDDTLGSLGEAEAQALSELLDRMRG